MSSKNNKNIQELFENLKNSVLDFFSKANFIYINELVIWFKLKTWLIFIQKEIPYFYEREIWFIQMWKNVWFEQDWKWENFLRPVIILKKFWKETFIWIPLTSKYKIGNYYLKFNIENTTKVNFAILSQIKNYSSKRLVSKLWNISKEDFIELKEKTIKLIF